MEKRHSVLDIWYNKGHMTIYLENFLPCSQNKFKKLLKLIEIDVKNKDILKEYCKKALKDLHRNKKSAKQNILKICEQLIF